MTDLALAQQWVMHRDAEAFKEILSRHAGMVYGTCLRILKNPGEAEELAQDCFLVLVQARHAPKEHLAAWLHRVATNQCLNRLRNERRRREREARYSYESKPAEPTTDDVQNFVDEAIAQLPEVYRTPIVAHFFENQSHAEIAEALGVARQTVTFRIGKGIEKIRRGLAGRGISVAASALSTILVASRVEAAPATLNSALVKMALAGLAGSAPVAGVGGILLGSLVGSKAAIISALAVAAIVAVIWYALPSAEQTDSSPLAPVAATNVISNLGGFESRDAPAPAANVEEKHEAEPARVASDAGGFIISGVVQPVGYADVTVTAYEKDPKISRTAKVDQDGKFEISHFSGETVYLYAEGAGCKSKLNGPIPLSGDGLTGHMIRIERTGEIEGRVVDLNGRAVPNALVRAGGNEVVDVDSISCDNSGRFLFKDLAPAGYSLHAAMLGTDDFFGTARVEVHPGERETGVDIVLDPGGNLFIAGHVTDTQMQPIPGANVRTTDNRWYTTTDSNGFYRLTGFSNKIYAVDVYATGYGNITVEALAGREDVNFVLNKSRTSVFGRVVRADTGEPVTSFEILLLPFVQFDPQQVPQMTFKQYNDREGRFTHKDIAIGFGINATVYARAQGYTMASEVTSLRPEDPESELVLRLQPEAIVEGVVINSSGAAVPGASIFIGDSKSAWAATSNSEGAFMVKNLSPTATIISATHTAYAPASADVTLEPGKTTTVRIVMSGGGIIEGTVFMAGTPSPGVEIGFNPTCDLAKSERRASTDSDGFYRIENVPPGEICISAAQSRLANTSMDGDRWFMKRVTVENGQTTQADMDLAAYTGTLEGTVVCGEIPAEGGGVTVRVQTENGEDLRTTTIADGAFCIQYLPPGSARLEVHAVFDGQKNLVRRKEESTNLKLNQQSTITIDFAQGATISGQLIGLGDFDDAFVDIVEGHVEKLPETVEEIDRFYNQLVWQGAPLNGQFTASGFTPGHYTVAVTVRDKRIKNYREAMASMLRTMLPVDLTADCEQWLDIPIH